MATARFYHLTQDPLEASIGDLRLLARLVRRGQIKDMKGIIDGQNQLLEAIQTNVAPIFKALAATVEAKRIDLSSDAVPHPTDAREGQGSWPPGAEAGETGTGLTERYGSPETRYL